MIYIYIYDMIYDMPRFPKLPTPRARGGLPGLCGVPTPGDNHQALRGFGLAREAIGV